VDGVLRMKDDSDNRYIGTEREGLIPFGTGI
jgi:hypothetical protein